MNTRADAIQSALEFFDGGGFRDRLAALVAIPSNSQDSGHLPDLIAYVEHVRPWLERMGFTVEIVPNPIDGLGPILLAERLEASGPTVITYGHGDTVRALTDQWTDGRSPWVLVDEDDRWYGRGTADNKGQHAINLSALEHVIAARNGRLGFSVKLVLEMGEEAGSRGLREVIAARREQLAADVLLASDGPRVHSSVVTISTGTRGTFHFDLIVDVRPGGVHSGNWGGITTDPAVVLAHAITSLVDRHGRILVRGLVPVALHPAVKSALSGLVLQAEGEAATIDPEWGEPGLTAAEKVYGWTSLAVLAMISGRPENPVNAIAPNARAHLQLRYTVDVDPATFEAAIRTHLDAAGFGAVQLIAHGVRMPARRSDPTNPWVHWAVASVEQTLGVPVQVIPNSGGGLPNDAFMDHLGVQLLWVPHSYNGCKQHGPDEHLLKAPARQGMAAFAGLWWDLGEPGSPGRTG